MKQRGHTHRRTKTKLSNKRGGKKKTGTPAAGREKYTRTGGLYAAALCDTSHRTRPQKEGGRGGCRNPPWASRAGAALGEAQQHARRKLCRRPLRLGLPPGAARDGGGRASPTPRSGRRWRGGRQRRRGRLPAARLGLAWHRRPARRHGRGGSRSGGGSSRRGPRRRPPQHRGGSLGSGAPLGG